MDTTELERVQGTLDAITLALIGIDKASDPVKARRIVVEQKDYWVVRLEELEAAQEERDAAEAQADKPETSEPTELQELNNRINRLKHRAGFDRGRAYKASSKADARLDRLEAWAEKLADWSDTFRTTPAPRLADDAR